MRKRAKFRGTKDNRGRESLMKFKMKMRKKVLKET